MDLLEVQLAHAVISASGKSEPTKSFHLGARGVERIQIILEGAWVEVTGALRDKDGVLINTVFVLIPAANVLWAKPKTMFAGASYAPGSRRGNSG